MTAIQTAVDVWRSYGTSPELAFTSQNVKVRQNRLLFLAALYAGIGYEGKQGEAYRAKHDLYLDTRQIVNPVKALCDFYAVHLYSGPMSPDGEREVVGEPAALPLVTLLGGNIDSGNENETNPPEGKALDKQEVALRAAFGQLSQGWWSWDTFLNHRVRQTEILGSLLTEIIDDPKTGKIMLNMVWPGLLTEIDLDTSGNVTGYIMEYDVIEPGALDMTTGRRNASSPYRYRKIVNKQGFYIYKDDVKMQEIENVYGFVPAVWDRAKLGWGNWGEPAIFGSQGAMDELNELWSHADDRMHQMFATPIVISGSGGASDMTFAAARRQEVNTVAVPNAGGLSTISFALGDVMQSITNIQEAVASECPELRVYDEIRKMSQVTGPGIRRAVADVEHRVNEQAALFDRQTIKLLQMGTAIAGLRATDGSWTREQGFPLTEEQKKFQPFGLDSFKAGDLDCMMLPRQLVRESASERIDTLIKIGTLDDPWLLEQAGVPQEEIDRMMASKQAARQAMVDAFATAQPGQNQQPTGPTGPNQGPTGPTGVTGTTGSNAGA